jgi:ATP-dependent RNA helicase DOB1
LTELLLNGHLASLTPSQLAALLSCFVFQEKSSEASKQLPEELQGPLRTLQEEARKVARIMQDCNLEVNVEAYVQSFRPHLMEVAVWFTCVRLIVFKVVFSWAQGARFIEVCKMTDVFGRCPYCLPV